MTWAHIHLALNHVPVIGLPIVLLLLAWALVRRGPDLLKASFGLLLLLALVTVIVQLTGEPAEELVEGLPGVLESMVERHEEAALLGTIGMVALGGLALFGLWRLRGERTASARAVVQAELGFAKTPGRLAPWPFGPKITQRRGLGLVPVQSR